MQEQEQRQRELRARLQTVRGTTNAGTAEEGLEPGAIFSPVDDYVEQRAPVVRLFFSVYDNLGALIAINFFTFLLTLPLLVVLLTIDTALVHHHPAAYLLPLLLVGLLAPPAWSAASSYCARTVEHEMHSIADYWTDYRRLFIRGNALALLQGVLTAALVYATLWYVGKPTAALKLVGVASFYLLLFWLFMSLYTWPLMVRGYRWTAVLRNAAVLVVASPLRTLGVFLSLVVLSLLLIVTQIGVVALLFSLWAMLPNQALILTRERLERNAARGVAKT